MIRAVRFERAIRSGSSLPLVLVGEDGQRYHVKLKGSGDGTIASAVEWLAGKLGRLLDLPMLEPYALDIMPGIMPRKIDPEIADLLRASFGLNFATRFCDQAIPAQKSHLGRVEPELATRIFLFDLFLLNIDRTAANNNFIWHKNTLICLDFAASLLLRQAITGAVSDELTVLRQIKRHPFCQNRISPFGFIRQLQSLQQKQITEIIDSVPDGWLTEIGDATSLRAKISTKLLAAIKNANSLIDRLDLLRILVIETEAQRQQKAAQNRNRFEKKFGRL